MRLSIDNLGEEIAQDINSIETQIKNQIEL